MTWAAVEAGAEVELDAELELLELEEEQAASASRHALASPAIRRMPMRRSLRIMDESVTRPSVRRLSRS
ncbi:MAG: hypothetical protein ACRDOU_28005 [Streptosporangiaceae bacterium]